MICAWKLPRLLACCLVLGWLGGCIQTKTTPGYARAGDHVVLGLGGIQRNSGGETALKAEDLTIVLTDFSGTQYPLEPRFIFKTYPDYNSALNILTLDGTNAGIGLNGMVPYDGGWFVVVPLTEYGVYSVPLSPLAVGQGSISVTSSKLINTAGALEGDQTAIPIEILPGTTVQDTDYTKQFVGYVAYENNFVISPNDLSGIDDVGGGFFVINYGDDTFFEAGLEPVVLPSDHNPYVQLSYNVVPAGDGTGAIYVTLLNPAGFRSAVSSTPNSSLLADLSVKLVYFAEGSGAETKTAALSNFNIDSFASYYIGMNGAVIPGITPTLTHAEDL